MGEVANKVVLDAWIQYGFIGLFVLVAGYIIYTILNNQVKRNADRLAKTDTRQDRDEDLRFKQQRELQDMFMTIIRETLASSSKEHDEQVALLRSISSMLTVHYEYEIQASLTHIRSYVSKVYKLCEYAIVHECNNIKRENDVDKHEQVSDKIRDRIERIDNQRVIMLDELQYCNRPLSTYDNVDVAAASNFKLHDILFDHVYKDKPYELRNKVQLLYDKWCNTLYNNISNAFKTNT
jgi:hypothetical protein